MSNFCIPPAELQDLRAVKNRQVSLSMLREVRGNAGFRRGE
jgi:hypothetical protein